MRTILSTLAMLTLGVSAWGQPLAKLHGMSRDSAGKPVEAAKIVVHSVEENTDRQALSGADGTFLIDRLSPGHYTLIATKEGLPAFAAITVELTPQQDLNVDVNFGGVTSANTSQGGFFNRFFHAYADDWKDAGANAPEAKYRGYPAPVTNPPFPFAVWPIGGTPWIGYPNSTSYPLTTALQTGPHGDWWKKANIQIYGWVDIGANASTSNKGPYPNSPAAYDQLANTVELNQATLYIERVPDEVQTDHFDWGFRLTNLYGTDYRFTTAEGYFSQQLLNNPKANGSLGNVYGYDPVMFYVDLYFPHIGEGTDVRMGRYISLPDIEAQLAPNNYTYTHSLTYTYDCFTQTGVNMTTKWSNHWTTQFGVSGGCEAALWSHAAKLTGDICIGYNWADGGDNINVCANSLNDGRYNYNNLAAYYFTWYHKFGKSPWHMAWEAWYQYESHTPNVNDPAASSLLITNANGAICKRTDELTCFAPEWATVHYLNRQLNKKNFISVRNEYLDDLKGQRTGFKTPYSEHAVSWNHWIGSTLVFRPEVRFDHAYDAPAYDSGTRKSQLTLAADMIWFY
jgi:hypothetical protein